MSTEVQIVRHNFYPVTEEAQNYRDLNEKDKKKELNLKISLALIGIIILIGMIAGVSSLSIKSASLSRWYNVEISCLQVGAVIVGFLGLVSSATAFGFISRINYDERKNGVESPDFKKKDNLIETALRFSGKGTLEEAKGYHYQKQGGLTPLVKHGIINPNQADRLRAIFEELDAIKKKSGTFTGPHTLELLKEGKQPEVYAAILARQTVCETQWREIQEEVNKQYESKSQHNADAAALPKSTWTWGERMSRAWNVLMEDRVS